jgi:general secretion pathway protein B
MSFILDALKKSESDRQRQTGPALFEVKIAPPKARFPVWAVAIAVLLGVNMIIVGWLLLRRPAHGDVTTASVPAQNDTAQPISGMQQPASPASAQWSGNAPPTAAQSANTAYGTNGAMPGAQMTGQPGAPGNPAANGPGSAYPTGSPNVAQGQWSPPPGQTQPGIPNGNGQPPPQTSGMTQGGGMSDRDIREPTLAGNVKNSAGGANSAPEPGSNPDDYAPATESSGSLLFKGHIKRGTESGLPLYQDAATIAGSNIPQLRLDLHVYAAKPEDRFALINMHKLHEGDSTPDGVRVENITPDGVIMSHNGAKFLLPRD